MQCDIQQIFYDQNKQQVQLEEIYLTHYYISHVMILKKRV
jgi:hypothetical protein